MSEKEDMDIDAASNTPTQEERISKNKQKKLQRLKRHADTREQWKADKKAKQKAAKQRKRDELAAAGSGSDNGLKRKVEEEEEGEGEGGKLRGEDVGEVPVGKKQKVGPVKRVLEPITLIMDCGFDKMMNDKEIISMSSQLTRCYAVNRAASHQVTLVVTSLNGRLLARYQDVMKSQHLKWKGVKFSDQEYEVTEENKTKGDLVYLTADSDDTVEDLVPGTSYIIGGIVDRNRYKSLCYNKAKSQGIRTAKLPIGEYIKMASRFVLTTNQVVEIMIKYLECRDWKEAFMEVIPQRKQPKIKAEGEGGMEEEQDGGDEEETVEKEVAKEEVAEGGHNEEPKRTALEIEANDSGTVVEGGTETPAGKDAPGDGS